MTTFAERLRHIMNEKNVRAIDLHNMTGIGKPAISEYLSGNYEPKQRNISRIATALHISPTYLMGFTGDPTPRPTNGTLSSPADAIVETAAPADLTPTDIPINELIKEIFADRPDVLSVLCTVTVNRDTINNRPLSDLDDTAKDTLRATILDLLEQQGLIAPPKKKLTLSDLTPEERQELKRELYQEEVRKKQERKKEIKAQSAPYTSDEIAN